MTTPIQQRIANAQKAASQTLVEEGATPTVTERSDRFKALKQQASIATSGLFGRVTETKLEEGEHENVIFCKVNSVGKYTNYIFAKGNTVDGKCGFYGSHIPKEDTEYKIVISNDGTKHLRIDLF